MEKTVPNHECSPQVLSGLLPRGWYKALYLLSPFSGSSSLLLHGQMILRNSQNLPLFLILDISILVSIETTI